MTKFGKRLIGIDFGMSNTRIGYYDETEDEGKCCADQKGLNLIPSVIFFEDEEHYSMGRMMETDFSFSVECLAGNFKHAPELFSEFMKVGERIFSPQHLSAFVYRYAMEYAKMYLEEEITDAVITVPASYDSKARRGMAEAAQMAEINVKGLMNEPTAALYYINSVNDLSDNVVLVLDLGGGKLDLLAAEVTEKDIIEIAAGGNCRLGGKDWNHAFQDYIIKKYFGKMILNEDEQYSLQLQIENAKKILSFEEQAVIPVKRNGEKYSIIVTRKEFEECTQYLIKKVKNSIQEFMKDSFDKGIYDFDKIIMVGGAARMPRIKELVKELFPYTDIMMCDCDEAVAKGAAIYGQEIIEREGKLKDNSVSNKRKKLTRISNRSYGLEVAFENSAEKKICNMIYKYSELPVKVKKQFYTNIDNQETVNLKIYETESSERYVDIEEEKLLGTCTLEITEKLPKNSGFYINFLLDEEGILSIRGDEMQEKTGVKARFDPGVLMEKQKFAEEKRVIDSMKIRMRR